MHRFSISRCCCGDSPPPVLLPPAFWGMATNRINLPSQDDPSLNEFLGGEVGLPHLEPQQFGYDSIRTLFEFGWEGWEYTSPNNPDVVEQYFTADGVCMSWVGGGPTRFQYGPGFVDWPNFGGSTYQQLRQDPGAQNYTVKLKFYMYNIQSPSPFGMSTLQWNVGLFWPRHNSDDGNPEHYRGDVYAPVASLNEVPSGIPQVATPNGMPNPLPYTMGAPGLIPDPYDVYTHVNTGGGNYDFTPYPEYFDGESAAIPPGSGSQIIFENDDSKPSINADGVPANISD